MKFHELYQNLFFKPLDVLRGRKTIERLKFLRASQYWSRERLAGWQLERLNELLLNARGNSPYYARALSGLKLPLESLTGLQTLPVLKKEHIIRHIEEIKCSNVDKDRFVLSRTGGSTGEPTWYYLDKRGMDWNRGSVYRSAEWADTYLGEPTFQMMGSHYDFSEFDSLKWKLIFLLQRYRDCPVAFVNDDVFERYVRLMRSFRPAAIWGYASGIHMFSEYIERRHPREDLSYVKALITSSETLQSFQREKIDKVFGKGKTYDHYGSREVYIASECREHSGYHIHAETIIVEIVDRDNLPARPGEVGRVLITDLSNHAFPFIRYEIGDVGVMDSDDRVCPCGITLPMLRKIEGRITDVLILPDRKLTSPNLTILMSDIKGVKAYQFVQDRLDELTLKIVKGDGYSQKNEEYIRTALGRLCGDVKVLFSYVDEIPVPKSGKRRYIISSIAKEGLG